MCFSDTTERKRVQFTPNSKRVSSNGRAESSVHNCIASRFSSSRSSILPERKMYCCISISKTSPDLYTKGVVSRLRPYVYPSSFFCCTINKEHRMRLHPPNIDAATVDGFGKEWSTFTQHELAEQERAEVFAKYFSLIDWNTKPSRALDMGCGSGRWDVPVAPLVGELVAADASPEALAVARQNVKASNVSFVECTPETLPFPDAHFDLIFSLGVLHHLPDTQAAIQSLSSKLAAGGTLLIYLYYAFDNRPDWFRNIWRISDQFRRGISRLPF